MIYALVVTVVALVYALFIAFKIYQHLNVAEHQAVLRSATLLRAALALVEPSTPAYPASERRELADELRSYAAAARNGERVVVR